MHYVSMALAAAVCLAVATETPEIPLNDARLSVHTLVREDVFAGIRDGDNERLTRAEKNIEMLLEKRPAEKPGLLVWKAGILMHHAIEALEAKRPNEFNEKYARVLEFLAEAKNLGPNDFGVDAATAGTYALLADRLPESVRGAAWGKAYESYQILWQAQGRNVDKLPLHLQGELLGGLAQSAQRTGHAREMTEYLDKILAVAPDSPYAKVAKRWKEDPKAAVDTPITCLSCHASGRLAARQAALERK